MYTTKQNHYYYQKGVQSSKTNYKEKSKILILIKCSCISSEDCLSIDYPLILHLGVRHDKNSSDKCNLNMKLH